MGKRVTLLRGVFFLFLLRAVSLGAQQPVQINYTTRDGLPSMEVYDVLQDSKGYTWFSTDAGVSRFDGYHFTNYSTADNLPDNTVFGMYEDHRGRIWFYTYSGRLAYWLDDSICQVGVNTAIVKIHGSGIYTSFEIDAGDTIWCGISHGKGFYKILPGYGEQDLRVIPATGYYVTYIDPQKKQLICGSCWPYNACLNIYEKERKTDSLLTSPSLLSGTLRAMQGVNGLMIGMMFYARQTGDSVRYFEDQKSVICLRTDRQGYTWMGQIRHGTRRMQPDGIPRNSDLILLREYCVTDVLEDNEGGYWVTTLERGVFYFPSLNCRYFNEETGLPANNIYSMQPAKDGGVWGSYLGTSWVKVDDSIQQFELQEFTFTGVTYVIPWNDGHLLLLTGHQKMYELATGKLIQQKLGSVPLDEMIYDALYMGEGWGWALSRDYLVVVNGDSGFTEQKARLPVRMTTLCRGNGDTLWLGGLNGLWRYDGKTFHYCGDDDPLLKNRVDDIAIDTEGRMWLATRGAGVLLKDGDSVTQFGIRQGMPSMICRSVCITGDTVWIGTNAGLGIVCGSQGRYRAQPFEGENWVISDDVRGVCSSGRRLWVSTGGGIVSFELPFSPAPRLPAPIYINAVLVNGKKQALTGSPELAPDDNDVTIHFVGISYRSHGQLRYRYRMTGLDTTWRYSEETSVQFPALAPGSYRFEVCAIGKNGIESKPAFFEFTILPPFWKTWWFLLGEALLFCVIVALVFRWRLKVAKSKTRIEHRIALLELSALRAQMNPHFIFNAINSIQHFILDNDRRSAQKYLATFAKLIRRVLEHSRHDTITLSQEIHALELYVDLEMLRFSSRFEYTLTCDPAIQRESLRIPPTLVQPFVENAILHGLMPLTERAGKLSVHFSLSADRLHCAITDNGIGREAARQNKLRKETYHQSAGLSVTQKRLEMLNLGAPDKVTVKITDLYDAAGKPAGTSIEIFIPYN